MFTHNGGTLMECGLFCAYDDSRSKTLHSTVNLYFCNYAELRLWESENKRMPMMTLLLRSKTFYSSFGLCLTTAALGQLRACYFYFSLF